MNNYHCCKYTKISETAKKNIIFFFKKKRAPRLRPPGPDPRPPQGADAP